MRSSFLRLWRRQRVLTLAFLAAVALAMAFTVRAVVFMAPFGAPPLDPPIEGWMTPRLVAHGWHLPPEVMAAAVGLEPGAGRGKTLDEIAEAQGLPVATLIARIEAAAAAWRVTHPPPAGG